MATSDLGAFGVQHFWQKSSVLLLLFGLLGCNQQGSLEDSLAPDPNLSRQQTALDNDAESDNNLPENFPPEIPIYPNATLIQSEPNATVWAIADSVEQLEAFYREALEIENWTIVNSEPTESGFEQLVATKDNLELSLSLPTDTAPERQNSEQAVAGTTFVLNYQILDEIAASDDSEDGTATVDPEENETETTDSKDEQKVKTGNISTTQAAKDLAALGVFKADAFKGDEVISRRQFARWLFTAHNKIYGDRQNQQIRRATSSSKPVFSDIPTSDPDFAIIQGLAEAGFLPSSLTNDTSNLTFRPDASLNRETLISWKVPLDRRQSLPKTTLDQIDETWGFQDATKVDPRALQALYVDFQNGDNANVRRLFGYTTLFQPKKSVTQKEAAIALNYFGFQNDGITAAEALDSTQN
ncbi:MAG: S-layer homology domain-containing protein [Limnothrix sp.]